MRVHVSNTLDDLSSDLLKIARGVRPEMAVVVRDSVREGAKIARANAKRTAGTHGKHYPRSITAEMRRDLGLFGNTIVGEYGPDANKMQGGMSFERGSRNQPPHNDLAKSADVIGSEFELKVNLRVSRWFWPES